MQTGEIVFFCLLPPFWRGKIVSMFLSLTVGNDKCLVGVFFEKQNKVSHLAHIDKTHSQQHNVRKRIKFDKAFRY